MLDVAMTEAIKMVLPPELEATFEANPESEIQIDPSQEDAERTFQTPALKDKTETRIPGLMSIREK